MILGLGIDLCAASRMRDEIAKPDHGIRDEVFTPAEIAYCESKRHPAQHYAARFAAKEALVKALAASGGQGSFWRDVEITNTGSGQPQLALSGRARELADGLGVRRVHVSLTHTEAQAAASVILEG